MLRSGHRERPSPPNIDVTTTQEAGLIEAADEQQATYGITENRIVSTHCSFLNEMINRLVLTCEIHGSRGFYLGKRIRWL
jgi:hypothetical protein